MNFTFKLNKGICSIFKKSPFLKVETVSMHNMGTKKRCDSNNRGAGVPGADLFHPSDRVRAGSGCAQGVPGRAPPGSGRGMGGRSGGMAA